MTTASDIVRAAFLKSGIIGDGESLGAGDLEYGLAELGDMLAQWNEQRWLIWNLIDYSLTSTGQATPYTVGPSGQFNMTPRPSRIQAAYVVQPATSGGYPVSTPLAVIDSYETYSRTALKSLVSFPQYVFLDTAYPLGNLYVYPFPTASIYTLHIICKDTWPVTLTSSASFANYPAVAMAAIKYNLARWLRQGYGKGLRPDPELNALAGSTLGVLKNSQVQTPEMQMPRILIGDGVRYNIFGNTYA